MTQRGKFMIKRLLLLLVAAAGFAVSVSACHTVHGAGEDISSAGDKIQKRRPLETSCGLFSSLFDYSSMIG